MARNCVPAIALIAGLGGHAGMAMATPLQECSTAHVPAACLDAKLKKANLRLNATPKAGCNGRAPGSL